MTCYTRMVLSWVGCALLGLAALAQTATPAAKNTEFKGAGPGGQAVNLSITDQNVQEAMEMLSNATGFNIIVSGKVTGKITALIQGMEPERALREVVEVNGFHYVRKDNVVWVLSDQEFYEDHNLGRTRAVIPLAYAKAQDVAAVLAESLSKKAAIIAYPETNVIVLAEIEERMEEAKALVTKLDLPPNTQVFQLQHATAADMLVILQPQVASPNALRADVRTNQVMITGTKETIDRLGRILKEFDKPDKVATRVFTLQYANADVTADLVREVLTGRRQSNSNGVMGSQASMGSQQAPKVFTTEPGRASTSSANYASSPSAGTGQTGAAAADSGAKAAATPSAKPSSATPVASWQSFRASAAPSAAPSAATGATAPTAAGPGLAGSQIGGEDETSALGPLANVTADTRTNSVIVTHVASVLDRVAEVIKSLDVPSNYYTYQFVNANPKNIDVVAKLTPLLPVDAPFAQMEPTSRKVTFRAPPEKAKELLALLKEWDEPVRQVSIEAEILRVNSGLVNQLGINWQAAAHEMINGVQANRINAEVKFPANIGTDAAQGRLTVGNIKGDDYTAVIQALTNDTGTQVIAKPIIVARDNEQAVFSSTRDEPYTVVSVSGTTNTTMEDVRFLNVGISLIIAPIIQKDNIINLATQLEISSLVEIRNNVPVVDRSSAQTVINIAENGTGLLGGLRQSSRTRAKNGIPGLSKVPLFGALFGNRKNDRSESEIVLVLRPHILDGTMENPPSIDDMSRNSKATLEKKELSSDPKE